MTTFSVMSCTTVKKNGSLCSYHREDSLVEGHLLLEVLPDDKRQSCQLVQQHLNGFLQASGYTPVPLSPAGQIANYERTKITTAYLSNVQEHFGDRLRQFVNHMLDIKNQRALLRAILESQHLPEEAILDQLRTRINAPATRLKELIALSPHNRPPHDAWIQQHFPALFTALQPFFSSYPDGTSFEFQYTAGVTARQADSIYYGRTKYLMNIQEV
ncbi:hypothetical protein DM01DRAFT_1205772 [Hesseltinella vesiculosa]|uniref:Uncharacterized protein n=1 Tax=Hesseltinella vesiculosa TaxID=101127 RepID=A0A1X2GPQ5_9FUNG|nr:hypothetical protein DM01DRAFT_1205772 [Hesseltinella vesiculosa]